MSDFNPQTNQQEAFPEIPQSDPQIVAPSPSVTSYVKSVPEEIKGFSWGGFFLAPVWGIFNGVWSSLLWFVPVFGQTVVPLVLGFKGREWAWKSRRWNSVDEFRSAQKKWGILGLLFTIFIVPIGLLYLTSSVVSMINPQGQFQRANEVAAVSDAQMGLTAIERYSARSTKLPFDSAEQEKVPFSIFVKQLEDAQLIKSVQADRLVQKQMYAVMTGPDVTDVKVCFLSELYKKESCVSRMGTSFLIE